MSALGHLSLLGGGPAGLAAAYFARKAQCPFTLYEASSRWGGNAVTFREGPFLFDSGAHRFHDKDPEMTQEAMTLMGDAMPRISVPSYIYDHGTLVDFPLSPLNLLKSLGVPKFTRAVGEVVHSRLTPGSRNGDFHNFAQRTYGPTIASRYLLNYSEKLWGLPSEQLSTSVAGKRLQGLTLGTFVREALAGSATKTRHLDGSFLYPRHGIGTIMDRLAEEAGPEHIHLNARITKVFHNRKRITGLEINGERTQAVDQAISTLPLSVMLRIMDPAPPAEILELSRAIRFRNILLIAFFLDKPSVAPGATVYFPDKRFPFTRVYEPRNRSSAMAPEGQTSLVVEFPCQHDDPWWSMPDTDLIATVQQHFEALDWLAPNEILGTSVKRIPYAYPVLEKGYEQRVAKLHGYLGGFENCRISGRNGKFVYSWIHDMMRFGHDIIQELTQQDSATVAI